MIDEGGVRQPAASQVHHKTLFQWIVGNLSWLAQYDTVYIFVDNRALQSRSLSGRHVSTGFLDPVLGAMMKQVCWHSRRSKAYRGLPEARMAGATVEETAFEDVNMWQAPPPS